MSNPAAPVPIRSPLENNVPSLELIEMLETRADARFRRLISVEANLTQTLYKKQEVDRITSPVGPTIGPRMPEPVRFQRVRQLVDEGAQLVEVLPREEFEEQHIQGAINVPLKELDADAVAGLSRDKAVIVYCWDSI